MRLVTSSGGDASHGFPLCHGVQPMEVGGKGRATGAASKFALEGWLESLRFDVAPYGISVMAVEPGYFRTELLVEGSSTIWPELSIED